MIGLLCSLALAQAPSPLEQAYQKEYAYLRAERAELEARAAELERDAERRLAEADADLGQLQGRLVAATRAADRAEDEFSAIERETAAMDDAQAQLRNAVQQASETLALPPPEDAAVAVQAVFHAAAEALVDANRTGWKDGAFFLTDGREVTGRIYTWGQIAAWGVSDAGAGALAPVGEGRLQVRRAFGQETALALTAGVRPHRLEVQLYEAERGTAEAEKAGGLGQLLEDAGTMGKVLFGLGCVSATLAVVRALTLLSARRGGWALVQSVTQRVASGDLARARELLGRRRSPTARVLGAVLDAADRSREEIDRVVDEALLRELPRVDRFASALVVITAGSPLLGLLGTVTGMIATFDVITQHGTGNPKLMSAGIAEALVCTALGLAVAIPTLLAGNVLASVGESIKNTLERGSLSLVNALELRSRATALVHPGAERAERSA